MNKILLFLSLCLTLTGYAQTDAKIGLVKYAGGGDWYSNPTSLPNLISYTNQNTPLKIHPDPETVEVLSGQLFNYPFIHITGHGNVVFSRSEKENLKDYLLQGGFLHVDDNYGMDKFIRPILENLFEDYPLQQLSADHPLFSCFFKLDGLPKTHEHDNLAPEAYGIFDSNGRMMVFYSYESDLGDGWEKEGVHNDPVEIREAALKMGANLLMYVYVYGGYPPAAE